MSYSLIKDRPHSLTIVDGKGKVMEVISGGSTKDERGLAAYLRDKYNLTQNDTYENTNVPIRQVLNSVIHEKTPKSVQRIYGGRDDPRINRRGWADLNDVAINRFNHADLIDLANKIENEKINIKGKQQNRYRVGADWLRWQRAGLH